MRACTHLILDMFALRPSNKEIEQARAHLQMGLDAN
jgi:hypothetical protein